MESTNKLTPHELRSRQYNAKPKPIPQSKSELDVLIENNRFLRDETDAESAATWEEQLSRKYEDQLFKEYALANLKHYKSGDISLRWRVQEEVLESIGVRTCASIRCQYHQPTLPYEDDDSSPLVEATLTTFQLPFGLVEDRVRKSVLVKVVLCEECSIKLNYSKRKERRSQKKQEKEEKRSAKEQRRSASPNR